jgi:hypothetical protein
MVRWCVSSSTDAGAWRFPRNDNNENADDTCGPLTDTCDNPERNQFDFVSFLMKLNNQPFTTTYAAGTRSGFCAFDIQKVIEDENATKAWAENAHYEDPVSHATVLRGLEPFQLSPIEKSLQSSSSSSTGPRVIIASVTVKLKFNDEFFAANQSQAYRTNFINKMAVILRVPASRIRIVRMDPGSVIMTFQILTATSGPSVTELADKIITDIANPNSDLVTTFGTLDVTYSPVVEVNTQTTPGGNAAPSSFSFSPLAVMLAVVLAGVMKWLASH